MKKFFSLFLFIIICFFMLALAGFPEKYVFSTMEGVKLWAFAVLPSLLPFFFLTKLLIFTNQLSKLSKILNPLTKFLFNCSGISGYVYFLSVISGYPIGANMIANLYNQGYVDKAEATRTSTFCSTSGPLFIIGSVGITMFSSKKIGLILFVCHLISSLICGLIFRNYGAIQLKNTRLLNKTVSENALYDSIYQSVLSILIVGGFVCIFYTLSQIALDFKLLFFIEKPLSLILGENAVGFCQGLIECTKGCKILSQNATPLSISLACGLISFGGLSIIFQSIIFLQKAKVNLKIFILSKFLQMIISIVICYGFCLLFFK